MPNPFGDLVEKKDVSVDQQDSAVEPPQDPAVSDNPFADLAPEPDNRGDFMRGLSSGIDQTQGLGYGLAAMAADAVDAEDFRDKMLAGYLENQQEAEQNAPEINSFEKAKETGRYLDYVQGTLGQLVPTMATMAGTGGLGGLVAKQAGKYGVKRYASGLAKKSVGEKLKDALVADKIKKQVDMGQLVGAAAGSMGLETGEIYGDIASQGGGGAGAIASSLAGGALAGGLDVIAPIRIARRLGLAGEAKQAIEREIYKRVPLEMLKQGSIEAITEPLQTAIEEGTKAFVLEQDLPPDLGNMMLESAIAGGIGGFAMGGLGGLAPDRVAGGGDTGPGNALNLPEHGNKPYISGGSFNPNAGLETLSKGMAVPAMDEAVSAAHQRYQDNTPEAQRQRTIDEITAREQQKSTRREPIPNDTGEMPKTGFIPPKTPEQRQAEARQQAIDAEMAAYSQEQAAQARPEPDMGAFPQPAFIPPKNPILAPKKQAKAKPEKKAAPEPKPRPKLERPRPIDAGTASVNPFADLYTTEPAIGAGKRDVRALFNKAKENRKKGPTDDFVDVPRAYPDEETIADNPEVKKPETMARMESLAQEAGWQEKGGKVMMDENGKVLGRTKWLPKAPWFADKPEGVTEKHFTEAIERLKSGRKLTKPQKAAAAYMLDLIHAENSQQPEAIIPDQAPAADESQAFGGDIESLAKQLDKIEPYASESLLEQAAMKDLSDADTKKLLREEIAKRETKTAAKAEPAEKPPKSDEASAPVKLWVSHYKTPNTTYALISSPTKPRPAVNGQTVSLLGTLPDAESARELARSGALDGNLPFNKMKAAVARHISKAASQKKKSKAAKSKAKQPAAKRFEVGKTLTKEAKKEVLRGAKDVYAENGVQKVEKGIDARGEAIIGYPHTPELFVKSDITGKMLRHYITLPDGRVAHPTELYPDISQSEIDREMLRREQEKKNKAAIDKDYLKNAEKYMDEDLAKASRKWRKGQRANIDTKSEVLYSEKENKYLRVHAGNIANRYLELLKDRGFVRIPDPAMQVLGKKSKAPKETADTFSEDLKTKGVARTSDGTTYKIIRTADERGYGFERVTPDGNRTTHQDKSPVGWTLMEARRYARETQQGKQAQQETDLAGPVNRAKQEAADLEKEKDARRNATNKEEPARAQSADDMFANNGRLEADLFDDSVKEAPAGTKPADQVRMTETVIVEETGEKVTITDTAKNLLDDSLERIESLKALLRCVTGN